MQIIYRRWDLNIPSCSHTSSILSCFNSTVGHLCGEHVNMVRSRTKITLCVLTVIMMYKLLRLLCREDIFLLYKTRGRQKLWQDKLDIQSSINITLLWSWVISADMKHAKQGYINMCVIVICILFNTDRERYRGKTVMVWKLNVHSHWKSACVDKRSFGVQ